MAGVTLQVRKNAQSTWIKNFGQGGWKVRSPANNGWVPMGPHNTKIRSADNTTWLDVK